jgi:hypothetical protein
MQVNMTQIQSILDAKLASAGLSEFVDYDRQRCEEFEGGLFVELAIRDSSKKRAIEEAIKPVQETLKKDHFELRILLRALWSIESIEFVGPSRADNGSIRAALEFRAWLKSGSEQCAVTVNVTIAAIDFIRHKLGLETAYGRFGWTPDKGDVSRKCVEQVVRSFLIAELEGGDAGYWDPLSKSICELDDSAVRLLLGQSTAFRDLRSAIQKALVGPGSIRFIAYLRSLGFKPEDFDQVLPELTQAFGGPFVAGDKFLVSATDLYNRLRQSEQELLRCYFSEISRSPN